MAMDPGKKKMLMIGIPVVVGIALIFILKGKSTPAATGTVSTGTNTNNGAIDVGQLSAFESTVSDQLAKLESTSSTPTVTPPIPTSPAPTPAPPPSSTQDNHAPSPGPAAFDRYGKGISGGLLGLGGGLWNYIQTPKDSTWDSAAGANVKTAGSDQYLQVNPDGSPVMPAPAPATLPGYGAGVSELEAANGGSVHSNPGIAGQTVSYNGVPL